MSPQRVRTLEVEWLGRVAYGAALELQEKAVEARREGAAGDRLLLLEHPPVITLGRSARPGNLPASSEALAAAGVEVHAIRRGGDVTYHAPGQLVGYLILDLTARGAPDVHAFLRRIEGCLIEAAEALGVPARRVAGMTGVFADRARGPRPQLPERKLASIGVGIRRWVSYHGFALNVSLDLSGFDRIVACGLRDVEMTSLAAELGEVDSGLDARARRAVADCFERGFAA